MEPLTPEQEDILRHHPASPAADEIRATGAKPDDTAAGKRAEMFRRRCDALIVELHGVLTKLGVDPAAGPESRAEAISKICEESNALRLIAELLGLSRLDPDVIRRRVKDIRTERDAAQARVKELEAACAQATAQISAQAGELGKLYAERDALKERAAKAEDALLKLRAAKCLDAMDDGAERAELEESIRAGLANLSSAGIVVEHAADPAREELAQIWELWGAGRPMTPGCVLDAAQEMERTSTALRVKLGAIAEKMDDEGFPTHYGEDERGGPVPLPDRVGMLLTLTDRLKGEALAWRADAAKAEAELFAAHKELADLGSPRFAGGQLLTVAHRIRALPGLLRPE